MTETEDACRKRATAERQRETRPTAFAPPMTETETEDACTKRATAERKRETRPTAFTPPMTETETEDACTKRATAERKRETRPTAFTPPMTETEDACRGREKERDQTNQLLSLRYLACSADQNTSFYTRNG
jgi:hypothetical protein